MNINEQIDVKYFLQDDNNPKYIFHGSRELFETLVPKGAKCDTSNSQNEQTAIYGSSIFEGAVPYAIKGKGKYNCEIGYKADDLKMKIYDGIIPEDDYGYIYVCAANNFVRCSDTCQFVSYSEVKPIEILRVYYRDFKDCFVYANDNATKNVR